MSWIYEQESGWLSHNGARLVQCYSGNGTGKNNPDAQAIKDVGPIPVGWYTTESPVDTAKHGPYVLWLIPDAANEMYGRSGFGIHGERVPPAPPGEASEGCIVEDHNDRVAVWESIDHRLQVVSSLRNEDNVWPNS